MNLLTSSGNPLQETGGAALYASLAYNSSLQKFKLNPEWIPLEFEGKSLDEVRAFFQDPVKKNFLLCLSCQTGNLQEVSHWLEMGADPSTPILV